MPISLVPRDDAGLSRRAALGGLAGLGLAATAGWRVRADQPAPSPWIALVSDTHIAADPAARERDQTMTENLRAVVAGILAEPTSPAAVVIDGDLALKDGQPGDYATLLEFLAPLRQAGIPLHMTLGNHDDRAHFRAAVRVGAGPEASVEDRHLTVVEGAGLRLVLLDSLDQVNVTPGRLGERQLDWLARTLDAAPRTATVVFVHHNLAVVPGGLADTPALLALTLPRRQVKAIVYGHSHRWEVVREPVGWMHLVNLPAVAYPFHPDQPLGWVRCEPRADGADLELRCVGGSRSRDRQRLELAWREGPR